MEGKKRFEGSRRLSPAARRVVTAALVAATIGTPTVALAVEPVTPNQQVQSPETNSVELSGTCGATDQDTLAWTLTENNDSLYASFPSDPKSSDTKWSTVETDGYDKQTAYTLTISGSGDMADYEHSTTPWGLALRSKLHQNADDNEYLVRDYTSPLITRVVFADGSKVTHIGNHAFRSTSIKSVEIPASVNTLGDYAFIMCDQLESISVADGVNPDRKFYVEDGVVYQDYVLDDGTKGTELRFYPAAKTDGAYSIKDGVTALGNNSLQHAKFTSVTIPDSVRSINAYAFNGCTNLSTVNFGKNSTFGTELEKTTVGGDGAFSNCYGLTTVNNFPKGDVPQNVFLYCRKLKTFTIPDEATAIGTGAFRGTAITSITVPSSITKLGNYVFALEPNASETDGAIKQKTIAVTFEEGSKLQTVGMRLFDGIEAYTVTFSPNDFGAYTVMTDAGISANLNGKTLPVDEHLKYAWASLDTLKVVGYKSVAGETVGSVELTIPDEAAEGEHTYKVVAIAQDVFGNTANNQSPLKKVTIGANVEAIGDRAFQRCTALESVDFSNAMALRSIGESAFYNDSKLVSIDLSGCTELESIGADAFAHGSANAVIKLPDNVTSWGGKSAVATNKTIVCKAGSVTANTLLVVLKSGADDFKLQPLNDTFKIHYASDWAGYIIDGPADGYKVPETLAIPDEIDGVPVVGIAKEAFLSSRTSIKHLTIGKNVATIGSHAFCGLESGNPDGILEDVKFSSDGVAVKVDARAFSKQGKLNKFDAGNREIELGDNALLDSKPETVLAPNATALGMGVFYGNSGLKTLVLGSGVKVNENTFKDSTSANNNGGVSFKNAKVFVLGSHASVSDVLSGLKDQGNTVFLVDGADGYSEASGTVVRYGYTVKWYKNSDFTDSPVENPQPSTVYYGKWALNDGNVELTFSSNYGDNPTVMTRVAVGNTEVNLPSNTFVRAGYTFSGWNTKLEGTGTTYQAGSSVKPSENMTFYAQWQLNEPEVTLSAEGDANKSYDEKGVTLSVTAKHDAEDVAYTYEWYKDNTLIEGASSATYTTLADVEASDSYSCKVTATVDGDSSSATSTAVDVKISKAKLPSVSLSADPNELTDAGTVAFKVNGLPAGAKVTSVKSDDGKYSASEKDGEWSVALPNANAIYKFTAQVSGGSNYKDGTSSEVTVKTTYKSSGGNGGGSVTPTPTPSANPVETPKVDGGSVKTDADEAKPGDKVTVTVTPDAQHRTYGVDVKDADGKAVDVTRNADGTFSFTMPSSKVSVTPVFARSFSDADYSMWYGSALDFVSARGIMGGYPNGTFGVGATLTRAELAQLLYKYSGGKDDPAAKNSTGMADVADGQWYTAAANWAVKNGVINGYGSGDGTRTFGADDPVTMEQLVAIIGNMVDKQGSSSADVSELDKYKDPGAVSGWAEHSVAWGSKVGLFSGSVEADGKYIRPSGDIARERVAAIVFNAFKTGVLK